MGLICPSRPSVFWNSLALLLFPCLVPDGYFQSSGVNEFRRRSYDLNGSKKRKRYVPTKDRMSLFLIRDAKAKADSLSVHART
nr:hypothetical protein Q903MT_gene1869 [Picea sitchensis]